MVVGRRRDEGGDCRRYEQGCETNCEFIVRSRLASLGRMRALLGSDPTRSRCDRPGSDPRSAGGPGKRGGFERLSAFLSTEGTNSAEGSRGTSPAARGTATEKPSCGKCLKGHLGGAMDADQALVLA